MSSPAPNILGNIANDNATTGDELSIFKNFLGDPATSIPINSNFVINFGPFPSLLTSGAIKDYEPRWNINATTKVLTDMKSPHGNCLFANGVIPPVESVDVSRVGMFSDFGEHSAGLLSGVVSQGRQQQPVLSMTFLETNKSFIDFVIRPWITLVAHRGLLARQTNTIKTTVEAVFFDSTGPQTTIRKYFRFNDCAPVAIASGTGAAFGTTSINVIDTSWVYSTYDIIDEFGADS